MPAALRAGVPPPILFVLSSHWDRGGVRRAEQSDPTGEKARGRGVSIPPDPKFVQPQCAGGDP